MKAGLIAGGAILIVIGILLYVYPVTSVGSFSDINDLCNTGLGQFGKALNSQVRESCQIAKYGVLGSYGTMGLGTLLVILGSVVRGSEGPTQSLSLSSNSKRTIAIGVGIAVAILLGAFAYQISLQPNIQVSGLNVSTNPNSQFLKVLDQGRVSSSGNFYYKAQQGATYALVFSNDFSIVSTKHVVLSYYDKGLYAIRDLEIPPGSYSSIPIQASLGQEIKGSFTATGGSGNDVDFYIATQTCSETISFSFNLANYGPVNGNADVSLESDGRSIWSNSYYVESQKQVSESGSTTLSDCNQHSFKMVVSDQKRVG